MKISYLVNAKSVFAERFLMKINNGLVFFFRKQSTLNACIPAGLCSLIGFLVFYLVLQS